MAGDFWVLFGRRLEAATEAGTTIARKPDRMPPGIKEAHKNK